jgi:hypothetical protein
MTEGSAMQVRYESEVLDRAVRRLRSDELACRELAAR